MVRVLGVLIAMVLLVPAAARAALPEPDPADIAVAGPKRVYNEVRMPTGTPRGVVIVLHAGGWCGDSTPDQTECGPAEDRVRDDESGGAYTPGASGRILTEIQHAAVRRGYIVVGSTYRSFAPGFADVLALYDQVHARWPALPVFAWGSSAGAHWSLMLGAERPLAGVIGEGTPADFPAWRRATLVGRYFAFAALPSIFAPMEADEYDPARYYPTPTRTPVLLISGEQQRGHEVDGVIGEATANAFARVNADLTDVELLRRGYVYWGHARVNAADLQRARRAALRFLDRLTPGAPPPVAAPTGGIGLCNDAAAGSALAGTGLLDETRGIDEGDVAVDVSENACAPTTSRGTVTREAVHTSVTDGLSLRVVPGPDGATVPENIGATATLDGHGQTITSYSAAFRGFRTDPGWELRLQAVSSDGTRTILATCDAGADCDGLVASGSEAGVDAPTGRQSFRLPPATTQLRWSLTCRATTCSRAATGDGPTRGLAAALNVYGATATIGVPAATATPAPAPTPVTTAAPPSAPAFDPEFGAIFSYGNRADVELACGDDLTVDRTRNRSGALTIRGYAVEDLIGTRVTVRRGGQLVGSARVTPRRRWQVTIPGAGGRTRGYVAASRTAAVPFRAPAPLQLRTRKAGTRILVRGTAPRDARGRVRVERLVGCDGYVKVADARVRRGRFTARLKDPKARALVLRATLRSGGGELRSY